jgi:threonyl-tRNA synthetase
MNQITVTFPDGNAREYQVGITAQEIAESISPQFAKKIYLAKTNGTTCELAQKVTENVNIEFLGFDTEEGRDAFLHSSAHLMAQAVKRIWPEAHLGFGPVTDSGFYYDIELDYKLSDTDFEKIEQEYKKLIRENLPVQRKEVPKNEAVSYFKSQDEILKAEHIETIEERGEKISLYEQGDFTDLCAGPHVPSTGKLSKHFKVMSIAGAYWKGDDKNPQLQRIYAASFPNKDQLKEHLHRIEEAQKRDHRKLGKELGLFSFHSDYAAASPFFLGKGTIVYNELTNYIRSLYDKNDYTEVITPQILDAELWKKSGHYDAYKENMYFTTIDEREYAVKPMNCPTHALIFSEGFYSYKDLPIRVADFGRLHRYEKSGATQGLTRVRTFAQDDAHVFCSEDQIKTEASNVIDMIMEVYNTFGFKELMIELSTRPEKSVGTDEMWEKAETALKEVLELNKINYEINEGDGAFYGPKIDFQIRDASGRSWQLGTLQLDFSMPERFGLKFKNTEGEEERPVMLHRAMLGSLERFFGILIEHFAGNFPLWIAPIQVSLMPIADRHVEYCEKLRSEFKKHGIRVEIDSRREKTGKKIREAEVQKIPYMLVIGDKEMESEELNIRHKSEGEIGKFSTTDFISQLREEIKSKKIN